jgi:hypothetical protein
VIRPEKKLTKKMVDMHAQNSATQAKGQNNCKILQQRKIVPKLQFLTVRMKFHAF